MILGGGWCECCSAEVGGDWEAGRWWWLRESISISPARIILRLQEIDVGQL